MIPNFLANCFIQNDSTTRKNAIAGNDLLFCPYFWNRASERVKPAKNFAH
jgi:hypothetical protein